MAPARRVIVSAGMATPPRPLAGGSLGVQSSSPSSASNRPQHPKRHHTSAIPATRSISYTLPVEPRSAHCPGAAGDGRNCTAESVLRDVLGKAGGVVNGARRVADYEEGELVEELRKARETLGEDMIKWADGVGDCPRAIVLQQALASKRPPSSVSIHSGRRLSSSPQPSLAHHEQQEDVGVDLLPIVAGPSRSEDQNQQHLPSTSVSSRTGFVTLDRRANLPSAGNKKRTHSTSSSPSVRSGTSSLVPLSLSSSPSSSGVSQHHLPSAFLTSNASTSSSEPSSASSTMSSGPLPVYHPHFRSPSSRPQRSVTCPIAVPNSPTRLPDSPVFAPSSLSSIMSSSSIQPPQRSSSRSRARPSFGVNGTPPSRTVSQPLVPTRARPENECQDFDLERAHQACKVQTGYVCFADVGVGAPVWDDDEEAEEEQPEDVRKTIGARVLGWFGVGGGSAAAAAEVKAA